METRTGEIITEEQIIEQDMDKAKEAIIKAVLEDIPNKCLYCGKETTRPKFCSNKCCQNNSYHNNPAQQARVKEYSKVYYKKNKDNQEYKDRAKKRFNKWLENNRAKFNDYMREYMKIKNRRIYHERKDAGKCTSCGGVRDRDILTCNACNERRKEGRW